jgi:quercetin dioxygenase-like cupin family protein
MKRLLGLLAVTLILGMALAMLANRTLMAQTEPLKITDVLKSDLAGMEGKEILVQLVEFAPRGATGKHYHPGHEANYILEGTSILEMEGEPPMTRKAGDSAYIPAKHIHAAKNASTTDPLKVLVFRIHEKGQPITVRVTEPYFWQ